MAAAPSNARAIVKKEAILLAVMLAIGILLLPLAIFAVGNAVFGDYGDGEYSDFYSKLLADAFSGNLGLLFLILSPYLVWQTLRVTVRLFRRRPGSSPG